MFDTSLLFQPLQVQTKQLRNRIVMPPMVVNRGLTTSEGQTWYAERARAGVGLVIVEATSVWDFEEKLTPENLTPLVRGIQEGGAVAGIQLFPGRLGQSTTPADLSLEDIEQLLASYERAATICGEVGFDAIEPHGAHGYLLNQFFSPEENLRSDDYGGPLENRMHLGLEIVATVRPIANRTGMLVLYRHTPVGPGYDIEESRDFARELIKAGVDILDISPASHEAPGDRAAPFVELGVPVIAVNQMDKLERALEALQEKRASLIAVGRGLITDYLWPTKVRDGAFEQILHCRECNGCFADLRRGVPVRCSQWPSRSREKQMG